MADSDHTHNQRSENYHRGKGFHQSSRPPYRGRGRGRGRADIVQQTLNVLGVTDLREHLDRKHQQDEARGGPPSDPSYNYLRDPMRDEYDQSTKISTNLQRSNSYSSKRGRGRSKPQVETFIENPMNIKVELSTSTGQRNVSVNEDSTLPNIKHIPDYQYSDYQDKFSIIRGRGKSVRARGRINYNSDTFGQNERAKSSERKYEGRKYDNWESKIRSRSVEGREDFRDRSETLGETRGRGNYRARGYYRDSRNRQVEDKSFDGENSSKSNGEWRGRGRGRGRPRGRGNRRGRGNYNQAFSNSNTDSNQVSSEDTPEENWDNDETTDASVNKTESFQNQEHHHPAEENQEAIETDDSQNQFKSEIVAIEENLLVTSSIQGNTKKRTVRFSLESEKEQNNGNDTVEVKDDVSTEDRIDNIEEKVASKDNQEVENNASEEKALKDDQSTCEKN